MYLSPKIELPYAVSTKKLLMIFESKGKSTEQFYETLNYAKYFKSNGY